MEHPVVYPLPTVHYESLSALSETRPAAVITDPDSWAQVGSALSLPIVVQAEPDRDDRAFIETLAANVPAAVEVVYAIGGAQQSLIAKMVAHLNGLPLVIIPTALDTDALLESHVELMQSGILTIIRTGAAEKIWVDLDLITAAPPARRAGIVADMLAIVTGLLDWKYSVKVNKVKPGQDFLPWAAGVAAGIASQTIKLAPAIGQGDAAAIRNLLSLTAISVQLASELGHDRHQEGTEHYFAHSAENQGVRRLSHAELLGPGILLTSALHGQDPSALRDALEAAGIPLNMLRPADVQLAINDLPNFALTNDLPHAIAHDLDPFSDAVSRAMESARLTGDTGGWTLATGDTGALPAQVQPQQPIILPPVGGQAGGLPPTPQEAGQG